MKRFLGIVLAGLVGAGTLFSGVSVVHAEEEVAEETTVSEIQEIDITQSEVDDSSLLTEESIDATEGYEENVYDENAFDNEVESAEKNEVLDSVTTTEPAQEKVTENNDTSDVMMLQATELIEETEYTDETDAVEIQEKVLNSEIQEDSNYISFVEFDESYTPQPNSNEITRYTVLTLDNSGSMAGTPLEKMREAAKKFCREVLAADGKNYVSITSYSGEVFLSTNFTDNYDYLAKAIDTDIDNTRTNIYSAVSV